jgi:predicted transcriptional regulator
VAIFDVGSLVHSARLASGQRHSSAGPGVNAPADDLITRIKAVTKVNEEIRKGLAEARAGKAVPRKNAGEKRRPDGGEKPT